MRKVCLSFIAPSSLLTVDCSWTGYLTEIHSKLQYLRVRRMLKCFDHSRPRWPRGNKRLQVQVHSQKYEKHWPHE